MSGGEASSRTCAENGSDMNTNAWLLNLPEDLLLKALKPGGKAPNNSWIAPDVYLPWLKVSAHSRIADWPLFQTCRQLRDMVLKHHNGLIVNLPARPDKKFESEDEYWTHFKHGCHALKRALEMATEHNIANVGASLKPSETTQVSEKKSWEYMHSQLVSKGVPLSQLRILKLSGLHVSETFFSDLAQSMPCLTALSLHGVQLKLPSDLTQTTEQQAGTALPLQHLEMVGCSFEERASGTEQSNFNVKTKEYVMFPKLDSFVYVSDRSSDTCPWGWLLTAVNVQQVASLTISYGSTYSFELSTFLPYELEHLKAFKNLASIKLKVTVNDALMAVLLNMPHLEHAELNMEMPGLRSDYSSKAWPLRTLVLRQYSIDKRWIKKMRLMPLDSPQQIEVVGVYDIALEDEKIPAFLAIAKRITWPAHRGVLSYPYRRSPSAAIPILPYIDYLYIAELDLCSELAAALASEAQRRVVTLRCASYPPKDSESVLPVLLERKRVLVLGPKPVMPTGPIYTWDLDTVWELLMEYRTNTLKLYHWSDRPEEYHQFERGFRRTDLTRELLIKTSRRWTYRPDDPLRSILHMMLGNPFY